MEYTISKLAKLANVSTRTLRYYDEINLLKPTRINRSGYRIYGQNEVDRLQQILFFRELDVDLDTIISILNNPKFDKTQALLSHLNQLQLRRSRLEKIIETVENTIAHEKGEIFMSNEQKFNAFKDKLLRENEEIYGDEIREKYGTKAVADSNNKFKNLSQDQYETMVKLGEEILLLLSRAVETGNPTSPLAQELVIKHKQWLSFTWPTYSKEAHTGLAEMYIADERFKAYYDKTTPGGAEFLRNAIIEFNKK